MKKLTLFTILAFFAMASFAQKYDDIKAALMIGKTDEAKKILDKKGNDKFFSKPEGWLLKSSIFSSMSLDSAMEADAEKNREEAWTAFEKYKEMEPSLKLLEDQTLKNGPFNLYASYFNAGVADINNKNYGPAYDKFKKVVDLSDILIKHKILPYSTIDTNANYYAGILAETNQKSDEATKYYTRLADLKVPGQGFVSVYQGLVRYYALKNDQANFQKFKAIGRELYPNDDYFTYTLLDFALGASGNFNEKVANLEKLIAANPNDYKNVLALGEVFYDTLNSRKEGAVKPLNFAELEEKMLSALKKANELKPEELQPILLLGDHYISKSEAIGEEMRPLEIEIDKLASKPKPTAADKQKAAELKPKLAEIKKKYDTEYDIAKDYFEKATDMFSKKGNLDNNQKRQYRIIVGNLAQYYSYKREGAKGADLNKIVALETKYNDLYNKLK